MLVQIRILAVFSVVMVMRIPGVSAWDDCPRGLVNDPYPGECSRYTDTNNDGICDHSQPEPIATMTGSPASPERTVPAAETTTVPVATRKAPIAPFPAVLLTVGAGLYLFRKENKKIVPRL